MSVIGFDIGSSSVKAVAFSLSGASLASAREGVVGRHPEPGWSEVDVDAAMDATWAVLTRVAASPALLRDPPTALAVSASGREVFPVAEGGTVLGPCLMTADTRGDDVAAELRERHTPEEWFLRCGHVPRRMDPVNRVRWWQRHRPDVALRARWFLNWHEYLSLRLTGQPIVDASDAGTWAAYDLATGAWSAAIIEEAGIDPAWLPEIRPSGSLIGVIDRRMAQRIGLPADLRLVTGANDTFAAGVGLAAIEAGVIGLACGTWHSYTTPIERGWPVAMVHDGLNVCPHPGPSGYAVQVTDPNGSSVIDWSRALLGLSVEDLDRGLAASPGLPGPLVADPAFVPMPHVAHDVGHGGSVAGLSLATGAVDICRAFMEAIACRFAISLETIEGHGIMPSLVRASGGGARSAWWMQLHADVSEVPVEVVTQQESGAHGAAMMAAVGIGAGDTLASIAARQVSIARRYEPDPARGRAYRPLVESLRERQA